MSSENAKVYLDKYFLIIMALFVIIISLFIKDSYFYHILILGGIYSILAIGLNILTGYCGQINLGIAGFYAIGAYAGALGNLRLGLNFWWCILFAIVIAGIFGFLIGFPALKVKGGVYLVLVTFGFAQIVQVVLFQWISLTRGPMGLVGIESPQIGTFTFFLPQYWFYLIYAFTILVVFIARRIVDSRIGRSFIAIRESDSAAQSIGISLTFYKVLAMVITSVFAGVAGVLYAFYMSVVSPDAFDFNLSVLVLMMIVIGGLSSIPGCIFGALAMVIIPEFLRKYGQFQMVLYALGIILIVTYLPNGILGLGISIRQLLAKFINSDKH